jgi:hypothetical protein
MKAILSLTLALSVTAALSAQNPDSTQIDGNADTTHLMLGKKKITIIDHNGDTDVKVTERDSENEDVTDDNKSGEYHFKFENDNDGDNWMERKHSKSFKGHWDAFQIGINSYLGADKSTSLPVDDNFMSLNTNKSININLNFAQQSFGLIGKRFGVVTGLGFEFSNYVFDNDVTIEVDNPSGNIISKDLSALNPYKTKLTTTYLTVPLLFELQGPGDKRSNRIFINAGVIGGLKLGSHTKYKYKVDGDKQTKKNRDDFNLNALRYGFTGRIGIKNMSLYGTYYPVSLFEKGKDPELYPFMVGVSFDGF